MKQSMRGLFIYLLCLPMAFASLALQAVDGQPVPSALLKDKWVVINYWAGWCQPCVEEIQELNRFYQRHQHQVALFAVNYDQVSAKELASLNREFNIRYPAIKDPARNLRLGSIRAIPATFIFDSEGRLQGTLYGGQTYADLVKFFNAKGYLTLYHKKISG